MGWLEGITDLMDMILGGRISQNYNSDMDLEYQLLLSV